ARAGPSCGGETLTRTSVAAAPATAAAAAGSRCGHESAVALEAKDGQLASDVTTLARGTRDLRRGAVDVLLELVLAAAATIFVDRHGATRRLAARSSSRTPRRFPRGCRRSHQGACRCPP